MIKAELMRVNKLKIKDLLKEGFFWIICEGPIESQVSNGENGAESREIDNRTEDAFDYEDGQRIQKKWSVEKSPPKDGIGSNGDSSPNLQYVYGPIGIEASPVSPSKFSS